MKNYERDENSKHSICLAFKLTYVVREPITWSSRSNGSERLNFRILSLSLSVSEGESQILYPRGFLQVLSTIKAFARVTKRGILFFHPENIRTLSLSFDSRRSLLNTLKVN